MAWITLAAGLVATATLLATIGALLYFTLVSLRRDEHSPPVG